MTSSASILTIAAFTVERYLAICHSLRAHATSGLSRAVRVVMVVWVAACVTAIPYPIHTRTYHYLHHPVTGRPLADSLICTIPSHWMPNMRYAFQVRYRMNVWSNLDTITPATFGGVLFSPSFVCLFAWLLAGQLKTSRGDFHESWELGRLRNEEELVKLVKKWSALYAGYFVVFIDSPIVVVDWCEK